MLIPEGARFIARTAALARGAPTFKNSHFNGEFGPRGPCGPPLAEPISTPAISDGYSGHVLDETLTSKPAVVSRWLSLCLKRHLR